MATPAATAACQFPPHNRHSVKARPMATGNVLWNTIAPVMFPSASVSFLSRIHMTLLNFSGSSVATGVRVEDDQGRYSHGFRDLSQLLHKGPPQK